MPFFAGRLRPAPSPSAAALLAAVALYALGCDAPDAAPSDAATQDLGPSKPADECFWGHQFADCGGSGTPRFACPAEGLDCVWFTGGVVAEGYLAWPCADGRICCEEGPDATYPHGLFTSPAAFFANNGAEPWTRERALALDVSTDAPASAEFSVACERDGSVVDDITPCREPQDGPSAFLYSYHVFVQMRDTLTVSVQQQEGFGSSGFIVEVVPGSSSTPTAARVCLKAHSDAVFGRCDPSDYQEVECATEGSVHVSTMPTRNQSNLAGVVVTGDVVFPSGLEMGFTMELREGQGFTVPSP